MAMDLGPGDILWTLPNTFVATANVCVYCGADVDFVDTVPATYVMSVPALEAKLIQADAVGHLPKIGPRSTQKAVPAMTSAQSRWLIASMSLLICAKLGSV